jgi:hypothetical protein
MDDRFRLSLGEHSRCGYRHVDRSEEPIGAEGIISRLVNHTNQSLRVRVGIFDDLINLTDIEGRRMARILSVNHIAASGTEFLRRVRRYILRVVGVVFDFVA